METMNNKQAALPKWTATPVTLLPSVRPSLASSSFASFCSTLTLEQNVVCSCLSNLFGQSSLCRMETGVGTREGLGQLPTELNSATKLLSGCQPLLNPVTEDGVLNSCDGRITSGAPPGALAGGVTEGKAGLGYISKVAVVR